MLNLHQERADRFMLDTIRLAFALDAVSTWGRPDSINPAVRQGYVQFADLLNRRISVRLAPEDETLMDWVLNAKRTRLKLLTLSLLRSAELEQR